MSTLRLSIINWRRHLWIRSKQGTISTILRMKKIAQWTFVLTMAAKLISS